MKYLKKKIAALILGSPSMLIFPSCLYGEPYYYNCQNDHHCRQFPNGKCDLQNGKDSDGNKGGYCEYPGYTRCPEHSIIWNDDTVINYVPDGQDCSSLQNSSNNSDSNSEIS